MLFGANKSRIRFAVEHSRNAGITNNSVSNYWLNALVLDSGEAGLRDAILEATNDLGIMTRPLWRPMHLLPMYAEHPRMPDLGTAEDLYQRVINLPSSPRLAPVLAAARSRAR